MADLISKGSQYSVPAAILGFLTAAVNLALAANGEVTEELCSHEVWLSCTEVLKRLLTEVSSSLPAQNYSNNRPLPNTVYGSLTSLVYDSALVYASALEYSALLYFSRPPVGLPCPLLDLHLFPAFCRVTQISRHLPLTSTQKH